MESVTVNIPPIGLEANFLFKEPYANYIKNILNIFTDSINLKVLSVVSMKELITLDNIDPFAKYYTSLGISEVDFKYDIENDVPIITLVYEDKTAVRVPLSYISNYATISQVAYVNKLLVVDLGQLPKDLDVTLFFNDIKDTIETRLGIRPNIKEVVLSPITNIDDATHQLNETARINIISIHDTNETRLQKLFNEYNNLNNRFITYKQNHP